MTFEWLEAVSYTHLDVYKRQEHKPLSWVSSFQAVSDGHKGGCDFLEVVAGQKVADELCVIGSDGLGGLPGN